VLEREGFIKSLRDGTMKRFYPVSVKTPDVRKRTPEELDSEILAVVEQRPGMTHKDLMEHLVVGNDVVKYHTRKLVRAQRMLSSKQVKTRRYYPLER
jgi:predicted transcriptional regulator